jgi:DNA polymerase III epsilon subunit-like protein
MSTTPATEQPGGLRRYATLARAAWTVPVGRVRAWRARRWARAMTAPMAAVLLDTETTALYGFLVEVAVLDACTGEVLLDTLIQPGEEISEAAASVHGIRDSDVADAPLLAEVLPRLLDVTRDRTVIAYNAEFDAGRIAAHAERDRLDVEHLARTASWSCLMRRRAAWEGHSRRRRLGGGHRALDDCAAARSLLMTMASRGAARQD